mgnify:CR=1 FL=1|jgi:hypothetical protein
MLRTTHKIDAAAMFMAPGYLRSQNTCGVKRDSRSLEGWQTPATGSCIGGTV